MVAGHTRVSPRKRCPVTKPVTLHQYVSSWGTWGHVCVMLRKVSRKLSPRRQSLNLARETRISSPLQENKGPKDILVGSGSPRNKDARKQMGNWVQKERGMLPPLGNVRAAWKFTEVKVTLGTQCGARWGSPKGCRWIWVLLHQQCRSHEGLLGEERRDLSLGVF